jgi:hypothetical protein
MIENFIAYKSKHMDNVMTQLFAASRCRVRAKDPNYSLRQNGKTVFVKKENKENKENDQPNKHTDISSISHENAQY